MKVFNKSSLVNLLVVYKIIAIIVSSVVLSFMLRATPAFADISPTGCTGSGLGINLFTNVAQANIGDEISYSVVIFNGSAGGPIVCDATSIQASLVTPDGTNHPISLVRTTLSDGEFDFYPNVVTYTAQASDITVGGILAATASDTGVIHQNITDSQGGGNQGLNVFVLNTLRVIKVVVNNNSGTATASNFTVHVKNGGVDVSGSPESGTGAPGTLYSLIAGTYVVSEDVEASYVQSFSGDCDSSGNVILLGSDDKVCTITNTDIPPASISVIKTVINDDGGTNTIEDFPLFVNGAPVNSGDVNVFPAPASYAVTETIDVSYAQTFSGDCDLGGNLTLAPGEDKVCTITNNDIPPTAASINVVKVVVNDNSGTRVIADFPLFVDGTPVLSGVTNIFSAPASHTVTETADINYIQTFSGDCDLSGNVTLVPGDNKICIITNDDIVPPVVPPPTPPPTGGGGGGSRRIPPLIEVVKVPDPLALPGGPGLVTYTYTLRNIGEVSMEDITMVGDTCSPIVLVSGDTDGDEWLDISETWVYSCTTTLSRTHTNTITATGWANGISAVDIASATVVVGGPGFPDTGGGGEVPPLIHVTKVPSPLTFNAGGGMVTYTSIVTNPGEVALSNVHLTDDKCGPVNYISGDTNGDSMLDTTEAWVYTCRTNLTKTTTNTIIAEGQANGMITRDFAIATVVVSIPGLPNTGFPTIDTNTILLALAGILVLLLAFLYFARKKLTV